MESTAPGPAGKPAPDDGFEAVRVKLFAAMLASAPFEGWTPVSLRKAAVNAGVGRAELAAAFPRGVGDILAYWSATADEAMAANMTGAGFAKLKIREKVAFAVRERLALLRPHKEAARRAAGTLALPLFAPLAAKLAWNTADAVWRGLDDRSTDFNFYSKRAILTGVWTSTFARWLADDSADETATKAFLDKRIENVMQIEKMKAKLRDKGFAREGMFGWLAKKRYPASKPSRAKQEAKIDEALKESFPASDPPYYSGGGAS
ncbi:MAG: COQ9 family protein [Pseudomonadota bacterium]|nr:COQ9 family protein [Pseudomonadota bacterium]